MSWPCRFCGEEIRITTSVLMLDGYGLAYCGNECADAAKVAWSMGVQAIICGECSGTGRGDEPGWCVACQGAGEVR